jgi:hypothetical protein
MNFFDHKDPGNHLLQLCPKVVKHPVYRSNRPDIQNKIQHIRDIKKVRHAKSLRLSWLGHVERMKSERWFQEVNDNLRRMRIGKWKEKAQE